MDGVNGKGRWQHHPATRLRDRTNTPSRCGNNYLDSDPSNRSVTWKLDVDHRSSARQPSPSHRSHSTGERWQDALRYHDDDPEDQGLCYSK